MSGSYALRGFLPSPVALDVVVFAPLVLPSSMDAHKKGLPAIFDDHASADRFLPA